MFKTVISFDMRAPDFGALYAAALEMCAYADKIGSMQWFCPNIIARRTDKIRCLR